MKKTLLALLLLSSPAYAEPIDWQLPESCVGPEVKQLKNDEYYWRLLSEELIISCQAMIDSEELPKVSALKTRKQVRKLRKVCGKKCDRVK